MNGGAPRRLAAAGLGAAAVVPLFLGAGSGALESMVVAGAYVVMALGLNVVVGFAGLLDLGYVAFFAIGAYVAAHFGSAFWADVGGDASRPLRPPLPGIHVNFLIVVVLAIAATTIAGVLIGVPTLRLRGDYVGIVTLAFGEIIGQVAAHGREIELFGGSLTGGPNGMTGVDRIDLPFIERFGALDLRPRYWFALALVALMLVVNVRLRDSRLGRAWIALREDEVAAASAGVPIVLSALNTYLLPRVLYDVPSHVGLDFDLSQVSSGIYGFVLVIVMLLRPQGLLPVGRRRTNPHAQHHL